MCRQSEAPSLKMEDVSHPSQSCVEQPHTPVNHSRPFFYVQPPSQPYFLYQWPMDPFGQYAFPGSVFPFGRPCMPPYQFMQYPGYVVPHAPIQPTDYRRLFPSVGSYDLRFRQHFQQMNMHRETMSSEAQTEPGASVNKLMDCLEGLQACEKSGALKDPNVMVSSTPSLTSNTHEVEKGTFGDNEFNVNPASQFDDKTHRDELLRPVTPCDSAVYDAESSQDRLDECVLSDVLPLDSSSIHDESQDQYYKQGDVERECFQSEKSGINVSREDHSAEVQDSGAHVSDCNGVSDLCEGKTSIVGEGLHLYPTVEVTEPLQMNAGCDLPYQILHLPCNITTSSLLQKDLLLYMDSASALLPSKRDTFDSPYTHSYYPQVAPERQSVLSPSLDELSSRDEMFSTDVEDDLTSGRVSMEGGKLAEASVPQDSNHFETEPTDEACSAWAKTCAFCGASLPDEELSPAELMDQECDCELEEGAEIPNTGDVQEMVGKQHLSRQGLSPCAQVSKPKARKVQEAAEPSGQDQNHGREEGGEQPCPAAKGDKGRGKSQKGTEFRSYFDHFQRESTGEMMDQENWPGCSSKQRTRPCRPGNGQERGRSARRRPPCKTFDQQRPRRSEYNDHNEAEYSYCQRGRGFSRRGARY